jgi:NAD(P)-dependent dehydrogenase (short-subunit alcohol dehydrogenase family)
MQDFEGKVAVVTGVASGSGRMQRLTMVSSGAQVKNGCQS